MNDPQDQEVRNNEVPNEMGNVENDIHLLQDQAEVIANENPAELELPPPEIPAFDFEIDLEFNQFLERLDQTSGEKPEDAHARRMRLDKYAQRPVYTQADKELAVRMLDRGITCREVAKVLGPHCSSGNPIRWRKEQRKRARLEAERNQEGNQNRDNLNGLAQDEFGLVIVDEDGDFIEDWDELLDDGWE